MKFKYLLLITMLTGVFFISTAQASGMYSNGTQASQYNPWRPQPQQWGYQNGWHENRAEPRQSESVSRQSIYSTPPSPVIPARQFEYRHFIHQVSPYYGNQMPWWTDHNAVPYGPWSLGNSGVNGFW